MYIIRNKLALKWAIPDNKGKKNITETLKSLSQVYQAYCREICQNPDNTQLGKIHILPPDITTLIYKRSVILRSSGAKF